MQMACSKFGKVFQPHRMWLCHWKGKEWSAGGLTFIYWQVVSEFKTILKSKWREYYKNHLTGQRRLPENNRNFATQSHFKGQLLFKGSQYTLKHCLFLDKWTQIWPTYHLNGNFKIHKKQNIAWDNFKPHRETLVAKPSQHLPELQKVQSAWHCLFCFEQ